MRDALDNFCYESPSPQDRSETGELGPSPTQVGSPYHTFPSSHSWVLVCRAGVCECGGGTCKGPPPQLVSWPSHLVSPGILFGATAQVTQLLTWPSWYILKSGLGGGLFSGDQALLVHLSNRTESWPQGS